MHQVETELVVAVAQPRTVMGAVAANVDAHAALIRRANARLVVFPELSLTGYQLGGTGRCCRPSR
ncbi:hypothetical protein NJB18001_10260 [Mycobacterium marinum]|nr:hypothetical protein NJB18001_10260 [Mycobacterium marinum]